MPCAHALMQGLQPGSHGSTHMAPQMGHSAQRIGNQPEESILLLVPRMERQPSRGSTSGPSRLLSSISRIFGGGRARSNDVMQSQASDLIDTKGSMSVRSVHTTGTGI